ncbi:hypothetical protein BH10ACI1_BH10ACI1_09420 [soil metagenome]
MKKCPSCKSIYSDDTLAFCLSDGTRLDKAYDSEQTLQLPNPIKTDSVLSSPTSQLRQEQKSVETEISLISVKKPSVSPVWIYSTVALLSLMIFAGIFVIIFRGQLLDKNTLEQTTPSPQNLPNQVQGNDSNSISTNAETNKTPIKTITYRVVGVAANDVLYIRPAPGNLKSFVGKIPPKTNGLIVTGGGVKIGKSVWYPVNFNGINGWISGKFIEKE